MNRRIIIGDDHPLVQAALGEALARKLPHFEVRGCSDLDAVLCLVDENPQSVALVLLDLHMPRTYGFAGLFIMHALHPTIPVGIVSAAEDVATIRRAIQYGAAGYLPKSLTLSTITEAVSAILEGAIWSPLCEADLAGPPDVDADLAGRFATLSAQQIHILGMIVAGKLNKQIGGELGIAEQTVKVHVSAILKKLGVTNRTHAAVLASHLSPSGRGG